MKRYIMMPHCVNNTLKKLEKGNNIGYYNGNDNTVTAIVHNLAFLLVIWCSQFLMCAIHNDDNNNDKPIGPHFQGDQLFRLAMFVVL